MRKPHPFFLHSRALLGLIGCVALLASHFGPVRAFSTDSPTTVRISLSSSGAQSSAESSYPVLSADGRWIAFASSASNLVASDTNEGGDIFVKDRVSGALACASISLSGAPSSGESCSPSICADGHVVVFASQGTNLVAADSNAVMDIFVRDLTAQTTTRASCSQPGVEGNGPSSAPRLSSDGRFVAFVSRATNLVSGDGNGCSDVFVRDLQTGTVERISLGAGSTSADGASEGPAISADGRFIAFSSQALNLLPGEDCSGAARVWDVYRRDRQTGTTVRVSISTTGGKGDSHSYLPAISADGRYVAFTSQARNLITSDLNERSDVFVRDLQTGTLIRASVGLGGQEPSGESARPSLSADGRYVVFESSAGNLVAEPLLAGGTWAYVRDLVAGVTTRVVAAASIARPDGGTLRPSIAADGHWIAFSSAEPDLVSGDNNELEDVFVRGPLP